MPKKDEPKAGTTQELGISYGQLVEGTLVGAVCFPAEVNDYRQQRVKPGVYTLHYALISVDGNHQGVAPNRDFLPAALPAVKHQEDGDPWVLQFAVQMELAGSAPSKAVLSLVIVGHAPEA